MPKEKIQDESGCVAQVTWSHDQYVQVATLSANPKEFVEWCREIVARADALKARPNDAHPETPHISDPTRLFDSESMGMFWTPRRSQINDLIRALRRSRDQAFGRDE